MPQQHSLHLHFSSTTVLGAGDSLTAEELARACGAQLDWVRQLAEAGILSAPPERPPSSWRFQSEDLQQALEVRRLQRDFDAGLDAAALMLDMGREIRRLRSIVQALGGELPRGD
ncbi:MerR family transcriptional regulator [Xylophilus rhododendri]|uniref:MerR family transcriptional regulator n=1 Tax=Xylophilus rhododendri TaxID=2697032 RepID=A0A857IYS5_9BURK|nr:chaperone modulator CbpM [Xylophilus rhododendri]QHI96606.1 MerR family transcriptional regulator [Xylophilus rhododendri]